MAGLLYRYDESSQYYLRISWDEESQARTLGVLVFERGAMSLPLGNREISLGEGPARLRLVVRFAAAQFWWTQGDQPWRAIGPELDAGKLSDDYDRLGFTGAFVGMACQDFRLQKFPADFSLFTYDAGG